MSAAAKILYVEDNDQDFILLSQMLEQDVGSNMELKCAPRLSDALKYLESDNFSAVLLDLNLVDTTGTQTVRLLHESHPQLPIVVFTASDEEQLEQDAFACGAQDYLVKGRAGGEQIQQSIVQSIRRKKMEAEFFYRSQFDQNTRLPNAMLMEEHLKHTFHRARRYGRRPALMLAEIQNYKTILNTFGRENAMRMLASFTDSMQLLLRDSDILAHWDDGCYALLLDDAEDIGQCYYVAERIAGVLQQPIALSNGRVHVSLSLGVAIFSTKSRHPGELVIAAKKALCEAREHFNGLYVYDMEMDE